MEANVAKVFELSKSENVNEEALHCIEAYYFELTAEERHQAIEDFVKEGDLKEFLKRPKEEILELGDKLSAVYDFFTKPLRDEHEAECEEALRAFGFEA